MERSADLLFHGAEGKAPAVHLCQIAHEGIDELRLAGVGDACHNAQLPWHYLQPQDMLTIA